MNALRETILGELRKRWPAAWSFWTAGASAESPLQDLCDLLYTLRLLEAEDVLDKNAAERFARLVGLKALAGDLTGAVGAPVSVHGTAYALGALNLLARSNPGITNAALAPLGWRLEALIDPETALPRWPKAWSHHSWRVSHWIGGAPSILASLWRATPDQCRAMGAPPLLDVLAAADALIDAKTGYLKPYRSRLVHAAFNALYRIRHDPAAGEVGGVVHLHWVNYAADRLPYKAAPELFRRSCALLTDRPFLEATPYCLDFDVVQIIRTAAAPAELAAPALQSRIDRYADDLARFFTDLPPEYGLHRLPGALATLHECALIRGEANVRGLDTPPTDIIREALWI